MEREFIGSVITGCGPSMDHFDHSFPFEHLIPIFITVCGPGDRHTVPIINLGSRHLKIFESWVHKKSICHETRRGFPVSTMRSHCWAANSFPIMDLWEWQMEWNWVVMLSDGRPCTLGRVSSPASSCIPHYPHISATDSMIFWRCLKLLVWFFYLTFNNVGYFFPSLLVYLLILLYWDAIFTNGKILLLHNHFNPSL